MESQHIARRDMGHEQLRGRTRREILIRRLIIRTVSVMYNYPLPAAQPAEVNRVIELYRTAYRMELTYDEAKDILERVMQFIYLTEVEDSMRKTDTFNGTDL